MRIPHNIDESTSQMWLDDMKMMMVTQEKYIILHIYVDDDEVYLIRCGAITWPAQRSFSASKSKVEPAKEEKDFL